MRHLERPVIICALVLSISLVAKTANATIVIRKCDPNPGCDFSFPWCDDDGGHHLLGKLKDNIREALLKLCTDHCDRLVCKSHDFDGISKRPIFQQIIAKKKDLLGGKLFDGKSFGNKGLGDKLLGDKLLGDKVLGGNILGGKLFDGDLFDGEIFGDRDCSPTVDCFHRFDCNFDRFKCLKDLKDCLRKCHGDGHGDNFPKLCELFKCFPHCNPCPPPPPCNMVPEPASLSIWGLVVGCVVVCQRRVRRKKSPIEQD